MAKKGKVLSTEWEVLFYRDENKREPVRDFLEGLDVKTQARFIWSIEQLRVRNISARYPLVRHIEGDIFELREESRTNIFRILYILYIENRIVLLHGFQKKTQETPRHEIEKARQRHFDVPRFIRELEKEREEEKRKLEEMEKKRERRT
jgi:phage-related protein